MKREKIKLEEKNESLTNINKNLVEQNSKYKSDNKTKTEKIKELQKKLEEYELKVTQMVPENNAGSSEFLMNLKI